GRAARSLALLRVRAGRGVLRVRLPARGGEERSVRRSLALPPGRAEPGAPGAPALAAEGAHLDPVVLGGRAGTRPPCPVRRLPLRQRGPGRLLGAPVGLVRGGSVGSPRRTARRRAPRNASAAVGSG